MAALGALVAGVAHELNTPLGNSLIASNTVRDHSRELRLQLEGGLRRSALESYLDDAESASAIIQRNLERAASLVSSFKQVAVDQASSQRRAFALAEVVDEIVMTVRPSLRRRPFRLAAEVDETVRLDSYPGALGQVLTNLITNAIVHGFEERNAGTVLVRGYAEGTEAAVLEVCDDGLGIPAFAQRRIFEPFFTTRMGRGGSGLGLHIVHSLVTNVLGGTITVKSTEGKGTRVRVTIPLQAPLAAVEPVVPVAPSESTG
jgi:signal transduction histidine kinase